jgi:hypothetical protein
LAADVSEFSYAVHLYSAKVSLEEFVELIERYRKPGNESPLTI